MARSRTARAETRRFVVEGELLLADAIDAGLVLDAVFAEPAGDESLLARAAAAGVPVHRVGPGVLARALTTVTPPPVAAVAQWCDVTLDAVVHHDFLVVLVDVADPGNAGTLVRSAEAAGAGAVLFPAGVVDAFNPKCVRASAGSVFRVGVVSGGAPVKGLKRIGDGTRRRIAAIPRAGTPYHTLDLASPVALVLGGEARGLPPAVAGEVDEWATIPMAGGVESLNVAMAGTVLCFEVARQRREAERST